MGSYATGKKILQDQTFLARLGKKGPNGVQGRSTIFAGGSHGAPGGGGRNGANVEPLQVYDTKISLYGNKKPSVRVQEVWDSGKNTIRVVLTLQGEWNQRGWN